MTPYFVDSYKDGDIAKTVSEDLSEADKSEFYSEKLHSSIFVQATLGFLVAYLFSQLKQCIEESAVFKGFSGKLEAPRPEIRFVLTPDELPGNWICNRVSSQKSCEKLVDFLFPRDGPPPQTNERIGKNSIEIRKRLDHIAALLGDLDVVPCDFESEMMTMAAQKLGVRNFQEAGIVPSFQGVKEFEEAKGHSNSNILYELVALVTYKEC
ncbi:unnamed protein product [Fusarium fujikuroi]|uniref:Uncharacterized protein n=1 Tax=Fusarium fujikuroi TaxID=5127 RepID=A0A9Q9RJF2_FUSFU|nr:unnamed protein product [Fusarium fujikuroi]VZI02788.1 unnamed protein product [Fusarium fujikuroi]